jgi:DNA-binding NarL/FixJ family response regulator
MRILIADDQPKVRLGLRVLLERLSGFEVVGEAVDAEELLAQAEQDCPDVVLLDWELPGMAGVGRSASRRSEPAAHGEPVETPGRGLLSALRRVCPDVAVIALSGWPEARQAALAAGAEAFVSKGDSPERLLAAVGDCGCGQCRDRLT